MSKLPGTDVSALDTTITEFLEVLPDEWLCGGSKLACEIRTLSYVLYNWPYPQAPWLMLVPLLKQAINEHVNPDGRARARCSYVYGTGLRRAQCRGDSYTTDRRCELHREGV